MPDDRRPLLFTHWGAYRAEVKDGRLQALDGLEGDPDPSPIGRSIPGALTDDLRIRQPMVRAGWLAHGPASRAARGQEPFVPVSWEKAEALVAGEILRVAAAHGNGAIFGGSYGWASAGRFHHAQSQLHRFLNLVGGYTASVTTHSYAAAEVLLPHILGSQDSLVARHTPWPIIERHTRLMVMFGGLPVKNTQISAGGVGHHTIAESLRRCRDAGTAFVNISPIREDTAAELGATWLPLRPNTDTALMLALAHTLWAEGLHDTAFLDRCCTGFDRVLPYLTGAADGQPKDADWAAAICGIEAETIRALARRMAATRTMIAVAWSLQRADHGEQPLWAAITLAAMLGQIGLPGGGFGFGYGGSNRIGNTPHPFSWPALPQGRNLVRDYIPVARLADMLLNPGGAYAFNGARRRYPDIRMVYWAGGNPFHHQQDLNKLVRAWQRPETVVVHEPWWNAMARHADIVLPCTTSAERNDLGIATGEAHLFAMRQLIEPVGEARSDFAILSGIAATLGLGEAFTGGRDEMGWVRHLYALARQRAASHDLNLPDFEAFWTDGHIRLPPPTTEKNLFEDFRAAPETAPLPTPSGRIELFCDAIAGFGYADCPGHAVWLPPAEWLGAAEAAQFPLHLISNQPRTRLHSQYDNGRVAQESKVAGREPVLLHPADAAARGITDGMLVRVFNTRGACLAGAVLSDAMMPGVVQLATGAWFDPGPDGLELHGNANVLTLDKGTSSLAQAPIAHSALVEVEAFIGEAPPLRVMTPPAILAPRR
ncbi:biotin/methionine sulfoxide reductase [Humitalea rosea]|uniref:Biotin/methionine sulfoxide reductase n=1 Tax=Humitalea rosea TaxID=990373 RepID=A0A2W7IVE7_9PROT|nr:molybdopterin guanine dinucleotide-containing S/N-oxide reductase [Humitalea rosea]PZW50483.1 biotin/methionine sulfoxide reductase [Humitalea rosea]